MKTAKEFLEEKGILIKGAETFPINMSRDTGVSTARSIIHAMDEYAEYKIMSYDNGKKIIIDTVSCENLKKLKLALEQTQKVCNEMNKCTNKFILQDSINMLNEFTKWYKQLIIENGCS